MPRYPYLLLLAVLAATGPAIGLDHDRARAALEKGEIRRLDEVLTAVRAAVPGDVIALDLKHKRKKSLWHYKVKILTPAGKRREVKIDAKTLVIFEDDGDDEED